MGANILSNTETNVAKNAAIAPPAAPVKYGFVGTANAQTAKAIVAANSFHKGKLPKPGHAGSSFAAQHDQEDKRCNKYKKPVSIRYIDCGNHFFEGRHR